MVAQSRAVPKILSKIDIRIAREWLAHGLGDERDAVRLASVFLHSVTGLRLTVALKRDLFPSHPSGTASRKRQEQSDWGEQFGHLATRQVMPYIFDVHLPSTTFPARFV